MTTTLIPPPFNNNDQLLAALASTGYAVLNPNAAFQVFGCSAQDVDVWLPTWQDLPPDSYLKDGGRYRGRRHSCFVVSNPLDVAQEVRQTVPLVKQAAHRPHWQPVEYNALHGGMQRLFEPMLPQVTQSTAWTVLLSNLGQIYTSLKPAVTTWFVEAHQFRIDTTDGIGRPTPEGAHRDGVDFVAVILIARHNIKGAETRVFDIASPAGKRFTMTEPWTVLLLNDERVIHESTPIQPLEGDFGYRDTLVITFRAKAFQGEIY
jgi:hypothetical protein